MLSNKTYFGAIFTLLLTACVSQSPSMRIDWEHGAKRGWIAEFYRQDAMKSDLPPCLASLPTSEWSNRQFVKVRYKYVRLMYSAVAELPEGVSATLDDQVEVWPEDCTRGKISRISRVLSE